MPCIQDEYPIGFFLTACRKLAANQRKNLKNIFGVTTQKIKVNLPISTLGRKADGWSKPKGGPRMAGPRSPMITKNATQVPNINPIMHNSTISLPVGP